MEELLELKLNLNRYTKYNVGVNFTVAIISLISIIPLMWLTYKIFKISGLKEKSIMAMLVTIQLAMIFMAILASFNIYVNK